MPIDFPNTPSVNDTYTVGNKTWIYDGTSWNTYNTTSFSAETLPGTTLKSTITGSSLTSVGTLSSGSVPASLITGATLPASVINSSLTSVGTLGSLTVTGDITVDTSTLKVDSTNNRVGVGTAIPSATLDVEVNSGSSPAVLITNLGTGPSLLVEDETSTDTTPFTIDASGNVGVGMVTPGAKVDVLTSTGTAMRITNTGSGNSFLVEDSATTDTTPFVIDASGNVGIGTTSVTLAKAEVVGSIRAYPAASQDAVVIAGRAGGSSSFAATLTPTTLTASRTLTLPDTTGDLAAFTSARGSNTAWTTFTSTITQLGNVTFSTQVSRYCQIGKLIHWQFSLAVTGTGTLNNAIRINIPQTAQANAIYSNFGTMHVYDASTNTHYTGHAFAYSTTQAAMMLNAGTTYFQTIALANSDIISGHIIYEAA